MVTTETIFTIILWGIISFGAVLIIGLTTFLIWFFLTYKHHVRLRHLTSDATIRFISDSRARDFKKDGVKYWKTFKGNMLLPVPPSEAIDVNKRGKYVVEGYITENESIQYIRDNRDIKRPFDELTTEQRSMLVDEVIESRAIGARKWLEYVPMITSAVVLIVVFVIAFMFYSEVVQPAGIIQGQNAEISKQNLEIMKEYKELKLGTQTITGEATTPAPS